MRISVLFCLIIGSGCANSPELPAYDLEPQSEIGQDPERDCPWPEVIERKIDGVKVGIITRDQAANLLICVEAFELNVKIADKNKVALAAMVIAHNAAVEYGRKLHHLATFELNEIDQRRRMAEIEALAMKAIIAIAAVASLL